MCGSEEPGRIQASEHGAAHSPLGAEFMVVCMLMFMLIFDVNDDADV